MELVGRQPTSSMLVLADLAVQTNATADFRISINDEELASSTGTNDYNYDAQRSTA